jgi:acetyl-CoA acetyltransferase
MSAGLRAASIVAGVGTYGLGETPGLSEFELLAGTAQAALGDAGLEIADVDAVFCTSMQHNMGSLSLAEYLGIRPKFSDSTVIGGSSNLSQVLIATLALQAGICDVALIAYASNQRSSAGRLVSSSRPDPYEAPYRPRQPITSYALAAARHMHQYGTTRAQLAEIAVAARQWAQMNPEAFRREPTSLQEVLAARPISDPFTVRDCCLVTDGGGAIVLTRPERAPDLPKPPAYVLGAAMAHWHRYIANMPDLTVSAATESGPRALEMAGVSVSDIDIVELYDAFTITTLMFLEDLGFCAKGEGGAFVEGGAIAPGGTLPVNTNGGGLSCCHPGMYGIFPFIEAVRQLRGECGSRQIDGAEVALAHGNGGVFSSQVTTILGGPNTP